MLLAMLLVQAQPLVGAALCHGHHEQPGSACSTGAEHHQSDSESTETRDHGEHQGDDQCAATHACAAATAVIRTNGPDRDALLSDLLAVSAVVVDSAPLGLRSPPFHPPKA
jgi:hypothetical protein